MFTPVLDDFSIVTRTLNPWHLSITQCTRFCNRQILASVFPLRKSRECQNAWTDIANSENDGTAIFSLASQSIIASRCTPHGVSLVKTKPGKEGRYFLPRSFHAKKRQKKQARKNATSHLKTNILTRTSGRSATWGKEN